MKTPPEPGADITGGSPSYRSREQHPSGPGARIDTTCDSWPLPREWRSRRVEGPGGRQGSTLAAGGGGLGLLGPGEVVAAGGGQGGGQLGPQALDHGHQRLRLAAEGDVAAIAVDGEVEGVAQLGVLAGA